MRSSTLTDRSAVNATSVEDCCSACFADAYCIAGVFDRDKLICSLLSDYSGLVPSVGRDVVLSGTHLLTA